MSETKIIVFKSKQMIMIYSDAIQVVFVSVLIYNIFVGKNVGTFNYSDNCINGV